MVDDTGRSPRLIVLLCGKRKSGKDWLAETLAARLPSLAVLHLSAPLKSDYAGLHGLSLAELLGSGPLKETHRAAMVAWSETERARDPGRFCRAAAASAPSEARIWLVADVRRRTDVAFFRRQYPETPVPECVF